MAPTGGVQGSNLPGFVKKAVQAESGTSGTDEVVDERLKNCDPKLV